MTLWVKKKTTHVEGALKNTKGEKGCHSLSKDNLCTTTDGVEPRENVTTEDAEKWLTFQQMTTQRKWLCSRCTEVVSASGGVPWIYHSNAKNRESLYDF
jgi:hypothetical protein